MNNKLSRISIGNYHKNCTTGEVIEYTKQKPFSPMKCHALIQLFNAETGELESEQLSENLINDSLNQMMYKIVMESIIFSASPIGYALSMGNFNLFETCVLTTYAGAEDATLKNINGSVVGWASKTIPYAGGDTQRGTVNITTSNVDSATVITYVFDWPTTSGNGIFQTIWWNAGKCDVPIYPYPTTLAGYSNGTYITGGFNQFTPMCCHDNALYYINSARTDIYKTKKRMDSYAQFTTSPTSVKTTSGDDTSMSGINWDGTNYWTYGSTNGKFYKYNSSFALQTSWACAAATYLSSTYQFACLDGFIYTHKRVNATTWNIYKFQDDGTLLATYNYYASYSYWGDGQANASELCVWNGNLLLNYSGYFIELTGAGVHVNNFYSPGLAYNGQMCADEYKNIIICSSNTNYYYVTPAWAPTAQNLLSVATTKTSANTMKITLTLSLDLAGI